MKSYFQTNKPFLKKLRLYLLSGLAIMMISTTLSAVAATKEVNDKEISRAIEMKFWIDASIPSNVIDINTDNGIVSLSGTVDNLLQRDRAEEISEAIVGVRGIVNRINIKESRRSDAKIKKAIKEAWVNDPVTESFELEVSVKNGIAMLKGTVQSWPERSISAYVAKKVMGVRAIENKIQVIHTVNRPDLEIEKEIEARLNYDVRIDSYLIGVKVKDKKVYLSGSVGSLAEKNQAIRDSQLTGVSAVNADDLTIQWWARSKMQRKSTSVFPSDEKIKQAIKDTFRYDPRVLSFNPEVEIYRGTVILSGVVNNLMAKKAAEEDASNAIGVWRVKNFLKVRPDTIPPNDVLEKRVKNALFNNPMVASWEIDVTAVSGRVYLTGNIGSWYEKYQAGRVSESVNGVTHVFNNITYVNKKAWKPDSEIQEDVNSQLFWNPFVDEDRVNVTVLNGVVTLSGNVDTLTEKQAAQKNAYEGGAIDVINQLTVTWKYHGPFYPRIAEDKILNQMP